MQYSKWSFEILDKNKKIFIPRTNITSFWGLSNVDSQILSSYMDVCDKTENRSIDKIHKRTLQLIYDTEDKTYQKGINRKLFMKIIYTDYWLIYQSIHYISSPIMWNLFDLMRNRYNLRGKYLLRLLDTSTCWYGTQAPCFKGRLLWNKIPNKYENLNSLEEFQSQIKQSNPTTCTCKICK